MGWSLEERRGRIVDAAVQLATDRGIEHLTLRAAADVAGMSWDTARESFDDHADLLRAVSTAVTRLNVPVDDVDLTAVPEGESFEDRALAVAHGFWDQLTSDRELQLVSFEILVLALRRTALRPLAAGQQRLPHPGREVVETFVEQHLERRLLAVDPDVPGVVALAGHR